MTIDLTEQEAKILVQLLDVAVKAGGLQVAAPAASIASKISEQMVEVPSEEPQIEVVE
tara:strand:- start:108 stop:281 length:174 start_codon:yes stop_codon:yes gene_type:complete